MIDKLSGRNGTAEFAHRSMKNLNFILDSAEECDVHPITQTITSLLAILIFPWERSALNQIKKKRLPVLTREGWPIWEMSGSRVDDNKVKNVGDLIELVRNSVAHGNVSFDSDSRNLEEVLVSFKNFPEGGGSSNWHASIKANELVEFCRRFSSFIADSVA